MEPKKDFYFSLKAHSKGSDTLKFELDFAFPFWDNEKPQSPNVYLDAKSMDQFDAVISFVRRIFALIATNPDDAAFEKEIARIEREKDVPEDRRKAYRAQIANLRSLYRQSKDGGGGISRILFEQHNPRVLTVSLDASVTGNGDMRPPRFDGDDTGGPITVSPV